MPSKTTLISSRTKEVILVSDAGGDTPTAEGETGRHRLSWETSESAASAWVPGARINLIPSGPHPAPGAAGAWEGRGGGKERLRGGPVGPILQGLAEA